jgi:hypothetical protein
LREIDVRLRSCSVSTALKENRIPGLHREELSAEVALMVSKVKDDVLRTNLEPIIHESVKTHFENIVYEQSIDANLRIAPPIGSDTRDSVTPQPVSRIAKASQVYEYFRHYFFDDIHIVTQTPPVAEREKPYAVRSKLIFHPSSLTILRGLQNRVELQLEGKALQGWNYKLRYFNAVSKIAPIFKLCKEGNIRAVEQLFGSGRASPWDVDEDGWTPLHVAAKYRHRSLCQLLLDSNSDSRALTYPKSSNSVYSPFDLAYFGTLWAGGDESEWIDLMRHFSDTADISFLMSAKDLDLESIAVVFNLNEKGLFYDTRALNRVDWWVFQNCVRDELGDSESRRPVMRHVIQTASESTRLGDWNYSTRLVRELLAAAGLDINITTTTDGRMLIHLALSGDVFISPYGLKVLLAAGADPNLVSNGAESCIPTQVALNHADILWIWRQALRESGYDLTRFIQVSSQQSCWDTSGWSEETLLQVFEIEFPLLLSLVYQNSFQCWLCGETGSSQGAAGGE